MSGTPTTCPEDMLLLLEAVARGDASKLPSGSDRISAALRKVIELRRAEALGRIDRVVEYNIYANQLAAAFGSVSQSSDMIEQSARNVARTSEALSDSVKAIDSSVQTSRRFAHEMRAAASGSRTEMQTALDTTRRTEETMRSAADRASSLEHASEKISDIVRTIDAIAMQTNLLALNASVEAARAGEAGRGFAVVAQEVRGLSEQTAKATADIRSMVKELQTAVSVISKAISGAQKAAVDGRENLESLGAQIARLLDGTTGVDDQLQSIADAITRQAGSSSELAAAASEASRLTDANRNRVEGADRALADLVSLSGRELGDVAQIDVPGKVARLAMADHVIWKKRLADMFTGQLSLKPEELSDHTCCRLGKWYYGPEAADLRGSPAFEALEAPHARVHAAGIRAVTAFNAGRVEEALDTMHDVEEASEEVQRLLRILVQETDRAARRSAA